MSDYSYVADRARQAFSSVARLEGEFARDPGNFSLQINLTSAKRMAEKIRHDLMRTAAMNGVEVCRYRLIPRFSDGYALAAVAKSLLTYQGLFSQIYDVFKSGKKERARLGLEAIEESQLDFGYSFSGSLGVVLLAKGERDILSMGKLDAPIDALYQVLDVSSTDDVRDIAQSMGNAVVKRVYDWSSTNAESGFATDVKWQRSDGKLKGQVVEQERLQDIAKIIDAASDVRERHLDVHGTLVGIDTVTRVFHFVVSNGADYRGRLSNEFGSDGNIVVPRIYKAKITEYKSYKFATEKIEARYVLDFLRSSDIGPTQTI
ncbi:hypothetical protein [Mesorhizobium sp. INR15]|uniref:hypothetical protein n=1 Tax=Mesorhizobium sp. INR15 TaxID=2654248 RepID=UPI0018968220|nr:hypothetical protein [Mesorhizobium sp. INR15]QPC91930.1 hypothetical protein GA829_15805 [Mesorhizobium sp. INR15]